jgi:Tol biopolymer transport system component
MERGVPIVLRAVAASGVAIPPDIVAWSVRPAAAGTITGDTLRPTMHGQIEIIAELVDGARSTRVIEIATPPHIVFDMVIAGNRDVWRAALDGSDMVRLTTHTAADYDPTIAGSKVVFVSERDGNAELYSVELSGKSEHRLTTTSMHERYPALSPDGERLAFARGSGLTRVYVANADAGNAVRPDPNHGRDGSLEIAPAWRPDNRTLAFVSTATGNPDIFLWNGGQAVQIVSGGDGEFEPAWSPDGRYIAFASTRDGEPDLYMMDIETGAVTRLTDRPGSDGFPAWLPDGRIVYVAYVDGRRTLRWLDPANPAVTYPIPLPGEPGNPSAIAQ